MMRSNSLEDPMASPRTRRARLEAQFARLEFAYVSNLCGPAAAEGLFDGHRASMLAEPFLETRLHPDPRDAVSKPRLGLPTPEDSSEDASLTRNTDIQVALPTEPLRNKSPRKTINITQWNVIRTPNSSPPINQSRKRPRPGSSRESQTRSLESQSPLSQDLKRRKGRPPGSLNKNKSDPSRNALAIEHVYPASRTRGVDTYEPYQVSHAWRKQEPIPNQKHHQLAQNKQKEIGTSQNAGPRLYNFDNYTPDVEFEGSVDDLRTASGIKRPLSRSRYEFEASFVEEIQPLIRQAMKEYEGKLPPKDLLMTGRKVN